MSIFDDDIKGNGDNKSIEEMSLYYTKDGKIDFDELLQMYYDAIKYKGEKGKWKLFDSEKIFYHKVTSWCC